MLSTSSFATQQTHVVTLNLIESILWHEGLSPQSQAQNLQKNELSEELSVALDLLEER